MGENGFNLEGLLRAAQADLTSFLVWLVIFAVVYVIFRRSVGILAKSNGAEVNYKILNTVFLSVLGISFVVFGFHAAGRVASNRLPRSDVDKSAVYRQMDSHLDDRTR